MYNEEVESTRVADLNKTRHSAAIP